jgi:hypothetical protein
LSGFEAFLQKIQKIKETRKGKGRKQIKIEKGLGEPLGPEKKKSPQPRKPFTETVSLPPSLSLTGGTP